MIEARHLTKRYGRTVAVDEASFVVRPGRVTGFLGPNVTPLELAPHSATLEEAFFELTRDETDYHAGQLADASKGM
jgi:hypothetical protein